LKSTCNTANQASATKPTMIKAETWEMTAL